MNLKTVIIFIFLIATIYQDFPLVNWFGEIARSPIFIITPLMMFYLLLKKKVKITFYTKCFILYIIYIYIITLCNLLWLFIVENKVYVLNENIIIKSIKMSFYPIIAFFYYQFTYTFLSTRDNKLNLLFKAVFSLEIFLLFFMILEIFYLKKTENFLPFIHSNNFKYWRIRLLTYEESWVGSIIIIITSINIFLVNYLDKSKQFKFFVYLVSLIFISHFTLKTESKGYMLVFLISTMPLIITYLYNNKKTRKFLFLGLAIVLIISSYIYISLRGIIEEQLHTSVTFGTRFSSYLASLKILIFHPIGVGWGPYLHYYSESLKYVISSDLMSNFNIYEALRYTNTSKSLSTKTFFFNQLIFGGLPFLIFFYYFFVKKYIVLSRMKNKNLVFIKIPFVYIILSGIIYITFEIKYEIWFFLAFIDVIITKLTTDE